MILKHATLLLIFNMISSISFTYAPEDDVLTIYPEIGCRHIHFCDTPKHIKAKLNAQTINLPDISNVKVETLPDRYDIAINNTTEYDVEALIFWTCRYLNIQNVWVNVVQLHDLAIPKALVKPANMNVNGKTGYNLSLKSDISKKELPLIIIHEMIHINQYESEQLKIIDEAYLSYKGKMINLNTVKYKARLHEQEAHKLDFKILEVYHKALKTSISETKENENIGLVW